jgi:hypothetical protein
MVVGGKIVGRGRRNLLVLSKPGQNLFQLNGSRFQLKAVDDLVDRYAGEGEYLELLSVARGVADDGLVVSLQIFGQNVSIQDGFEHCSEHDRRARRAPSLLVSDGDNLIQ